LCTDRRLALTEHPDKSKAPDATARFQRIQDALTRIQEAEECGRWDDDDSDDGYDDYGYDGEEVFFEDIVASMFGFGVGGGGRGGGGIHFAAGPGFPSGAAFAGFAYDERRDRRLEEEDRRWQQRRVAAEAARRADAAEVKRQAEAQLNAARERAQREAARVAAEAKPPKHEQLRRKGNEAFASSKFARCERRRAPPRMPHRTTTHRTTHRAPPPCARVRRAVCVRTQADGSRRRTLPRCAAAR
jgi:DnaJ-class molecular chaperone